MRRAGVAHKNASCECALCTVSARVALFETNYGNQSKPSRQFAGEIEGQPQAGHGRGTGVGGMSRHEEQVPMLSRSGILAGAPGRFRTPAGASRGTRRNQRWRKRTR
eukprot:227615-Chlamydomonas_euryale.AAC.1